MSVTTPAVSGAATVLAQVLRRHAGCGTGEELRRLEVACNDQLGGQGRLVPTAKVAVRRVAQRRAVDFTKRREYPRLVKRVKVKSKAKGANKKPHPTSAADHGTVHTKPPVASGDHPRKRARVDSTAATTCVSPAAAQRLHALWQAYAAPVVPSQGAAIDPTAIAALELLGSRLTVLRSPTLRDLHHSGVCVRETDTTLHVLTDAGKTIVLPKAKAAVRMTLGTQSVDILSSALLRR